MSVLLGKKIKLFTLSSNRELAQEIAESIGLELSECEVKHFADGEINVDISETVNNFIDSMTSYVDKYEDVFNGNVAKEIGMYSRQAMIVGMNLKASDKNIRNFDMNI